MLKTSGTKSAIRPGKGVVRVGSNSKAKRNEIGLNGKKTGNNKIHDDKFDDKVRKKDLKTSKSKNLFKKLPKSKKTVGLDFFTLGAKLAFTKLKQAFLKTPILYHFDPEHHIQIETDVSDYAIGGVLS